MTPFRHIHLMPQVIEMYQSHMTMGQIGEKLGISSGTVLRYLRNSGTEIRSRGSKKEIINQFPDMLDDYNRGMSITKIAEKYGHTRKTVTRAVRTQGVDSIRDPGTYKRKYQFDECYFSEIDTEAKAYWLGFVVADGAVCKGVRGSYSLRLGLSERDVAHIAKFLSAFGADDVPIITRHNNGHANKTLCHVTLSSQILYDDLLSLGLHPNKSSTVEPPIQYIPEQLHRHFWRGVVDGDGSIYRTHGNWSIKLCGNLHVVGGFAHFVSMSGISANVKPSHYGPTPEWFRSLSYGKHASVKIADILYGDATVYLDRKYASYNSMKDAYIGEQACLPI